MGCEISLVPEHYVKWCLCERDLLMKNITEDLNSSVREELGIEIVDIRVKRIDLPSEVSIKCSVE